MVDEQSQSLRHEDGSVYVYVSIAQRVTKNQRTKQNNDSPRNIISEYFHGLSLRDVFLKYQYVHF